MDQHIDWLAGLAKVIAAAVVLGGGSAILNTKQDVAVMEARYQTHVTAEIESRQELKERLDRIEDKQDRLLQSQGLRP